ncbi:hypothetical protein [Actinocatenispora rupis]|uniref:Uncharacterized protein n=1 Tax=Actinocatenispora rupis TaxID=519421 RepID=A0A8J3NDE1_9ACTN|nr:hypothetical protein [Actinocatenispora rupis]GID15244.1 hypothetical protein Aru02nite_61330 [Actinocatenispora rupis]
MAAGIGTTGRTELLVVCAIAAAGVAMAAAVSLAPWHPSQSARHPETSTVIELHSPRQPTPADQRRHPDRR